MKHQLMLIEWLDSRTPTANWQFLDDAEIPKPCKCISVGFLISDDGTQKVIASHLNDTDTDTQVMGMMSIPSCSIVRIVDLAI